MPAAQLTALAGGRSDADRALAEQARAAIEAGQPLPDVILSSEDEDRIFGMIAGLIVGWRVWDPLVPVEVDDDGNLVSAGEPPRLPLPATAGLVGRLPQEILTVIMEEVGKANPQKPPAPQADGTSRTS